MDTGAVTQGDPSVRQKQQGAIQQGKAEGWMEVPSGLDLAHEI